MKIWHIFLKYIFRRKGLRVSHSPLAIEHGIDNPKGQRAFDNTLKQVAKSLQTKGVSPFLS